MGLDDLVAIEWGDGWRRRVATSPDLHFCKGGEQSSWERIFNNFLVESQIVMVTSHYRTVLAL